jgi:hypothetical protein
MPNPSAARLPSDVSWQRDDVGQCRVRGVRSQHRMNDKDVRVRGKTGKRLEASRLVARENQPEIRAIDTEGQRRRTSVGHAQSMEAQTVQLGYRLRCSGIDVDGFRFELERIAIEQAGHEWKGAIRTERSLEERIQRGNRGGARWADER